MLLIRCGFGLACRLLQESSLLFGLDGHELVLEHVVRDVLFLGA